MAEFKRAAVIGTGTMGPGMGAVLARIGIPTTMYDVSAEAIERAKAGVALAEGVLDRLEAPAAPGGSVTFESDLAAALEGADIVLEAVPERLELKHEVFREFEKHVGPGRGAGVQHLRHPDHGDRRGLRAPRAGDRQPLVQPAAPHPDDRGHPGRAHQPGGRRPHLRADPRDRLPPGDRARGPGLRREPRPLRDHARVPRPGGPGHRLARGARPERALGHRLQARRGRPDGPARHGRHGHLRRGRLLPEQGPLQPHRRLLDGPGPHRRGPAGHEDRRRAVRLHARSRSTRSASSAPGRSSRCARRSRRRRRPRHEDLVPRLRHRWSSTRPTSPGTRAAARRSASRSTRCWSSTTRGCSSSTAATSSSW